MWIEIIKWVAIVLGGLTALGLVCGLAALIVTLTFNVRLAKRIEKEMDDMDDMDDFDPFCKRTR